jgi:hypothetical protein
MKVVALKADRKTASLVSLEECRRMLNTDERRYTDDELMQMREILFLLARMYHDYYNRTFSQQLKPIRLNNVTNDTQESNPLCTGEYRRAG